MQPHIQVPQFRCRTDRRARRCAAALAVVLMLTAVHLQPAAADSSRSGFPEGMSKPTAKTRQLENGAFVTEGKVEYQAPAEQVVEVLGDFPGYSEWAVQGLDAHPNPKVDIIGIITDVAFSDYPRDQFVFTYNLDLVWPFGRSDQLMRFDMEHRKGPESMEMKLQLHDPGMTLNAGSLLLEAEGNAAGSTLRYTVLADFAWYIRPFFNPGNFEGTMRWRVEQVLKNLAGRLQQSAASR